MITSILRALGRSTASPWETEDPIREELFSADRLETHAESLAAAQKVTAARPPRRSLAVRLRHNESVLLDAYRAIGSSVRAGRSITPAAEWLLENYHLVEEQIREVRDDLPPGYYWQLPKLAHGPFAGYPRVFGIAWAFVAHTDSRFDSEMLYRFVHAYQRIQPLTIGELWAVAITLRIVLVENLRRAAQRIVSGRAERQQADSLADHLLGVDGQATESAFPILRKLEKVSLPETFAVQLIQRLRDQDPNVTPALIWLEGRLTAQGTTVDAIVSDEHRRQGASNVTVRNIVTSLHLISQTDWTELFERISLVDDVLRANSDFASMDFPTRNLYRSAIEKLARGSKLTELDIARVAVRAATDPQQLDRREDAGVDRRERDPGYRLIAGGRQKFERTIGFRAPVHSWLVRFNSRIGIGGYIGGIVVVSAAILLLALLALGGPELGARSIGLLMVFGLIPSTDLAIAIVNRIAMVEFGTTILPGMALRGGVTSDLRTMIVVPTLLTTLAGLEEQIERLEIHYLTSPQGDLRFALLSDWTDAPTEHADEDEALLEAAAAGVAQLNLRYGSAAEDDRFLLFHRRRVWNDGQQQWIGWERKRGKLHELNRLLRGATDTTFMVVGGRPLAPPLGVRFVITLDGDTRLPPETVRRLVGKMAHPLNHPRFDSATGRVVEGYALLQPRVTPALPIGREGSLFQRIFSSMNGIDPYAAAVSDVYQDLFGEGSYAGKGIYDVDAFEAALAGRVPESTLLSHDLFEGTFARAGLASDIEVVDEFPARYDVAAARLHRWARGDWQLLPWLFGRADASRGRLSRALPLIGRWKMLDNLRRTLSAPTAIMALLAGWDLPLQAAAVWTGFILSTIAAPTLLPVLAAVVPRRSRITTRSHFYALGSDLWLASSQTALAVTFTAHQAWSMTDAISRTLFRLFVSHRLLLEWTTAADAKRSTRLGFLGFYRQMAAGAAIGIAAAFAVWWMGTDTWFVALPFIVLWIASPAIALWTSRPARAVGRPAVSEVDARALRLIARWTWRYFETFVTSADHMLPPDNFQEDPDPVIAHRTSPTNLGLYLLATVSARDFGWIGTVETVERLEATLETMGRLERFRGHFYNWYGTQDLLPLYPRYISSVDSGNLAGHLIALANACRAWIDHPLAVNRLFGGIDDALNLTRDGVRQIPDDRRTHFITRRELDGALEVLRAALDPVPLRPDELAVRLTDMAHPAATMVDIVLTLAGEYENTVSDMLFWAQATQRSIHSHRRDANLSGHHVEALNRRLAALASAALAMANAMEFGFLLDPDRRLLSIGYLVPEGKLDVSCYDLIASEARLASFVAIAKGDVPSRHWFRLGRAITPIGRGAALISWSGSMFEYLMPSLVMRAPASSLLEQTSRLIVRRQISYAAGLGVPWGISESAFNIRDLEFTYQYSNFGVPGLGLKRGLGDNIVVAPYATALAAMVEPAAATQNFSRLTALGARGRYGFYEALDYTRAHLPKGQDFAIVRAFMAHHQGMTVVAIANALLDAEMRRRFHAEPIVQATELLLQERTPRDVAVVRPRIDDVEAAALVRDPNLPTARHLRSAQTVTPAAHLLSNGRYAVMLTAAGSGYSRWRDLAITRWREDATCDDWGAYVFLRDVGSGDVWSAGYQPTGVKPASYDVRFTEDRAEFVRHDGTITTVLDVVVSPEDDSEVRRVSVSNMGSNVCDIEITSYAELVLAPPSADAAHLAFSKLFVQTEYISKAGAILATRRRRSPSEPAIWAAHLVVVEGETLGEIEIETDRSRFLGRGREARSALAVTDGRPLSNSVGTVLDPVFSLRRRVRVKPGETVRVAFWTIVASSRADVLDLVDKHYDATAFERAATFAWTRAQVQLHHFGVDAGEAALFQRLAGHVLFANPSMRPSSEAILRGIGDPAALWSQGISGDVPVILLRVDEIEHIAIVAQLLRAQEYWRTKQLAVDLVILNERASSYVQDLQIAIETAVATSRSRLRVGADGVGGAVFILRTDLISRETRAILPSVARVVLAGHRGDLVDQLDRMPEASISASPPPKRAQPADPLSTVPGMPALEFFNGLGGFAADGREYVTILGSGQSTPAPWINVIANPTFGFQVAVEGGGYSWSINSRENQLTPWSNDPVSDRPGEVIFVRDEDTGELWGPTALPIRDNAAPYIVRHGQGYSRFEHAAHSIELDLLQYVALQDPIKISRLRIRNISARTRQLSVTAYVEWVLGASRSASAPFIVTEIEPETGAMLARNPWNVTFGPRVAFADLGGRQITWTGDRREFLGRNGTLDNPAALAIGAAPLSKRVGAGLDPCGVLHAPLGLKPDEVVEIVFLLGETSNAADAQALIARYRTADLDAVFLEIQQHWDDVLGTVQVSTPDRSMDIMLNRWLLYQTIVCRLWARAGFYQASGAYGFRDQLQDGMALALTKPAMTREHLLRAAARQFIEGDVQHWWLPPFGQGVRTRISDDRIWLAYTVAQYVETTGDSAILSEPVPFLEGQALEPGEQDAYFQPTITDETASLFEHCARGLDHSLGVGEHGLPLIGTGDWNDGMNRVGELGRGESVWLGWFLHTTLSAFAPLAETLDEPARAAAWRRHASALQISLEREGWDGNWYLRGYFDDGTPFGSAASEECQIDSIAQSWSVISGAADPGRAARAMAALETQLVQWDARLALLFTPPFDHTSLDPGYVKGYPPGIRENGGQYTHAAAWSVIAFAMLGDGDRAARLFSLINPINHARTRAGVHRFKVEPYVVVADIYSQRPHVGRGGWTWYTGSAGWLYRAGIESILGLRRHGTFLLIAPCIPKHWPRFQIVFRHLATVYDIVVENPHGVSRGVVAAELDGQPLPTDDIRVPLCDDGARHEIRLILGEPIAK